MKNKIRNKRIGMLVGVVAAIVLVSSSISINQTDEGKFQLIMDTALAEYAGLGGGASGWLEIYLYPHDANPAATYAENTSATLEAASLAYFDTDGWSTTTFPSETSFDIVIRCRFNRTHCYKTDKFIDTRARVSLTVDGHTGVGDWAVGSDFSDSSMTGVVSHNSTGADFIWINYYLNNTGTGYQLADDGQLDFSAPKIEAKY